MRNIQTRENVYEFFLSQTDGNRREAKPQQIEKSLRKMAVSHLILYIKIKREDLSELHKVPWWYIRKVGESKGGPLGLDKK